MIEEQNHPDGKAAVSSQRFKAQLYKCSFLALLSLIGGIVSALVMFFDPDLSTQAAVFTAFIYVLCVCVFAGSLIALVTTLIDMWTYRKLRAIKHRQDEAQD